MINDSDTEWAIDQILHLFNKELEKTEKAYGGCHSCYGKGYSTRLEGYSWSGDFEDTSGSKQEYEMVFCSCDRGKELKKWIDKIKKGKK